MAIAAIQRLAEVSFRTEFFILALSAVAGFLGGCGAAAAREIRYPSDRWLRYLLAYGIHGMVVGLTVPLALQFFAVEASIYTVVGVSAGVGISGMLSTIAINAAIKLFLKTKGLEIREIDDEIQGERDQ